MAEEQQKNSFAGKLAHITGKNRNGEYSFYGGSMPVNKMLDLIKDYKEANPDCEDADGKHKIPITITKIPDQYVNIDAKYPKKWSILVGGMQSYDVAETTKNISKIKSF